MWKVSRVFPPLSVVSSLQWFIQAAKLPDGIPGLFDSRYLKLFFAGKNQSAFREPTPLGILSPYKLNKLNRKKEEDKRKNVAKVKILQEPYWSWLGLTASIFLFNGIFRICRKPAVKQWLAGSGRRFTVARRGDKGECAVDRVRITQVARPMHWPSPLDKGRILLDRVVSLETLAILASAQSQHITCNSKIGIISI